MGKTIQTSYGAVDARALSRLQDLQQAVEAIHEE